MRVKKQKRHRKVVRFFSACFGFREPFKVLCDGTFVHHLLLHRLIPADDVLAHLLGGRALLFTTKCIIAELRSLGESHAETLEAAQQLNTARCDHERRVSAMACIESIVGKENSEHFFVATQDVDLRKQFRELPGVPVVYGLRNSLFIEQPSAHQREFVKSTEENRLHISDSEYQKLHKKLLKDISSNEFADEALAKQATRNISSARTMLGVAEKSKFKKKKAKGPNPLSCKKKKKKDDLSVEQNKDGHSESVTRRKRTRKRRSAPKDGVGGPGS